MTDPTPANGRQWQRGVEPTVAQQVRQLAELARDVDGVAPLSGHVLESLTAAGTDEFLLRTDGDRLVGVAVLRPDDPAELVVHPDSRGHGIGGWLLDAAIGRAGRVWAHGQLPAAQALADARGLTVVRTLLQMRRSLPAELEAPLPQGIRLRSFVPGQDEQQFLGVNARAFAWHPEQGRLDAAGLADEMAKDWFDPAGFFLAVDRDDTVLGFHWTKVHPIDPTPQAGTGEPGPIGEVYVLAVDPQAPVRGLGAPLTAAGLRHLAAAGLPTVMLYVEGDNERAVALYRRFGFRTTVTDVVYAPRDLP
ncbi:mycothiol synthase [Nakamurella lactea]|uniref:mycothiol synthase n=1 Tax=Nakamurella lactea TaxID=459515 RepID=UPI000413334A|nr:mycothiol synthase [Nakamurella lactea]